MLQGTVKTPVDVEITWLEPRQELLGRSGPIVLIRPKLPCEEGHKLQVSKFVFSDVVFGAAGWTYSKAVTKESKAKTNAVTNGADNETKGSKDATDATNVTNDNSDVIEGTTKDATESPTTETEARSETRGRKRKSDHDGDVDTKPPCDTKDTVQTAGAADTADESSTIRRWDHIADFTVFFF